jgi:GNAT superfamily N-acetyltransferase
MITVIPAKPADSTAIAELAEEMDAFYGATGAGSLELRAGQINEAIFSNPPSAYLLLAWDRSKLVGFAAYSFLWPALGLTRSLYLKEMYIAEAARRKGIGKLLMQHLYDVAVRHDCSRLEWTTDNDNADARRFYAELGVPVMESKIFYRIECEELRRQAART